MVRVTLINISAITNEQKAHGENFGVFFHLGTPKTAF